MKSIEHKSFRGTVLGLISFLLNIVYSLMLIPVFLTFWGDEKYGYFLAIYAFVQLMRTLDTGHQIYVGNEFSKSYYQNPEKAYEILSSSIGIAFVLGFIELLVFLVLWYVGVLDYLIGVDMKTNHLFFWGILGMLIMWWLVGSIGGILARIILAKGYYSESVMFAILIKFIETIILFIAVYYNYSINSAFFLIAFATLLYSAGVFYWTAIRMPEYFPWWKNYNMRLGFKNFGKSMVLTTNGFLDQLNSNGTLFLIGKYLSAGTIPVFTTIRTLTNTMTMLTNLMIQPLIPEMIRFDSEGQKDKIWKIIEVNWFISGALISFSFLFLIPVVDMLFRIWTNGHIEFNNLLFYLLALSVVAVNFGRSMTSYLIGINDLKGISAITYVRFLLVFGCSFLFIDKLGLLAIGLGILISEMVCSVVLPTIFARIHLRDHQFDIFKLVVAMFPMVVLGLGMFLCYIYPEIVLPICLISGSCIAVICYWQWNALEGEVRYRILHFIQNGFRRVPSPRV